MTTTGRVDTAKSHWYKLDGNKAPGVTTIIGDGIPKPALIAWGPKVVAEYVAERLTLDPATGAVRADDLIRDLAELGRKNRYNKWPEGGGFSRLATIETLKGVHWEDRDKAANKGTAVHGYAERLIAGEEVEPPEELLGHVDAYIEWVNTWQPVDTITEAVIGNRTHGYMGTLDMIATLRDGRRWLLDIKTSRGGPFQEVALQLAAYRYAEFIIDADGNEQPMPPVDVCGVIWVRADGADLYRIRADETVMRTFLYVKQVAHFQKTDRDEYISDALTPGDES